MNTSAASVLVVDDDEDTCQNLSDILGDLGYQVDLAYDAPAALELLGPKAYDVALLDLRMPGMDGLSLFLEIKKVRPATVAIFVTGYSGDGRVEAALAAGAWQVVPKPVNLPRLMRTIEEALALPLVLIVDDDPDLCTSLGDVMRGRGYRVCFAYGVGQAKERLKEQNFDVVLLDLQLPDGDGTTVLRDVQEANPAAGVIVITGHAAELAPAVEQALAEGVNSVVQKPFDVAQLLSAVQRLARPEE
jgi:CheY-like chemotaxis protein